MRWVSIFVRWESKQYLIIDPIMQLAAPAVTTILEEIGTVVHTLVPEKLKFTEDNKVGQYPHPIDITTNGNGFLYMLDYNPMGN